jgi:hypothetical protein
MKRLFGNFSVEYLDSFGRYLILRQQRIYRVFATDRRAKIGTEDFSHIYKGRCKEYYEHSFFAHLEKA